ncbi:MAG: MBL fold metallo-hydrolase [Myxococcales bacterium]|nr:MBL fold metallo-hydrolase [Myxococcales bacterium]
MRPTALLLLTLLACKPAPTVAPGVVAGGDRCGAHEVALQVLGSGGPTLQPGRASASYLVWIDGEARALVDAGGGSFLRFADAGAQFESLAFLGLTHLHVDHAGELPAFLKASFFTGRDASLTIAGPTAGEGFPGLVAHLQALVGPTASAYPYLSWTLDPAAGAYTLTPVEVAHEGGEARTFTAGDLQISAVGVAHGPVPALAYRIETPAGAVVFAGDQGPDNLPFRDFARGARVLVMHHAIAEGTTGVAARLHAPPSVLGEVARDAEVGILVLGHNMDRALVDASRGLGLIRERFAGEVVLAQDLTCVPLSSKSGEGAPASGTVGPR